MWIIYIYRGIRQALIEVKGGSEREIRKEHGDLKKKIQGDTTLRCWSENEKNIRHLQTDQTLSDESDS